MPPIFIPWDGQIPSHPIPRTVPIPAHGRHASRPGPADYAQQVIRLAVEGRMALGGLAGGKTAVVAPQYLVILPKYNDFDDSLARDCRRVPMSGADRYFAQGDLIVSERLRKLFPFCVECKHRKNFRLEHVFMGVKDFLDYHRQVMDACKREGNVRTPMVVIRGQGGLIFAAVPSLMVVSMKYRLPDMAAVVSYRTTHLRWFMTDLDSMLQAIFTTKEKVYTRCQHDAWADQCLQCNPKAAETA